VTPRVVSARSQLLTKVGYVDLVVINKTYTSQFFEREIEWRERHLTELETDATPFAGRQRMDEFKRNERAYELSLEYLRENWIHWKNTGYVRDEVLRTLIQHEILQAVRKTGIIEGFSIILTNTGNFVYGSDEVNLTDKVLFRLNSLMLDRYKGVPALILEALSEEEYFGSWEQDIIQ
jgi:hypothetical protein